ncbi:hypothetical protein N0O92_05190 [Alkalihalobacillus sp. MEB130]|uniref:hypothetical protein n=1 Tax=Alkalihalobacillus sp. MEB130 TaxID=2976704 RepID=UPI0028E0511A|nr:hypothetical protein [Alkalihalobacillus sp. MEB130]MDT8859621.1 hypothetical protein [Alkalihalobacillus sp. MEB130]
MYKRKALMGILIFTIITILSFFLLQSVFGLGEGISVVLALIFGGIVEFIYQRRRE